MPSLISGPTGRVPRNTSRGRSPRRRSSQKISAISTVASSSSSDAIYASDNRPPTKRRESGQREHIGEGELRRDAGAEQNLENRQRASRREGVRLGFCLRRISGIETD